VGKVEGKGIMNSVSFTVRGLPMPKGSTTRMPNGATLPAGTAESRKRMQQWTWDIRNAAQQAMDVPPFTNGIRLMCEFRLPVPATSIRKYQQGWLPHTKKPDVDKLFRALSDALTGIVWRDDAQVCISSINKIYAWAGDIGATVVVDEISEESAKLFAQTAERLRTALDDLV
jgi:crossover junction endodeoxyribonuclease RusA